MNETSSVPVQTEKPPRRREAAPSWPRLDTLRDEVDRLFDAFEPRGWFDAPVLRPFGPSASAMAARALEGLSPAMDLVENGTAWLLTVEVPGIPTEAIEVKLSNGMLTVSGQKSEERTDESADRHLSERRWGAFRRALRLPEGVDAAAIEASHANGVLTVRLPKSASALAAEKTIAVKPG